MDLTGSFNTPIKRSEKRKAKAFRAKPQKKAHVKIPFCWVHHADKGWQEYHVSVLYDDNFDWLDKHDKYLKPSFDAGLVMNVEREGTKFWRQFRGDENTRVVVSRDPNDSEIHTAQTNYYAALLPKLKIIKTPCFENGKTVWRTLANLKRFKWEKEKWLGDQGFRPDIYGECRGFRSVFNGVGGISKGKILPDIICAEIIDKGPPSEDKLPKLLKFSKEHNALIVLGMITHEDPDQKKRYFYASKKYKSMTASHYIWDGCVYRNGVKAPWLNDFRKLRKEIQSCQIKMKYFSLSAQGELIASAS